MLFDLARDPAEQTDLAMERPELVDELRRQRDAMKARIRRVRERLVHAGLEHVRPADLEAGEKVRLERAAQRELEALGYAGDER
jgi:hypothetical protein